MKNHFILPYAGNKRNEVDEIFKHINFEKKTVIIEPYCGTSAMSYYISKMYPKQYNYILNDNNNLLLELYKIMKDEEKTDNFNKEINSWIDKFNEYNNDIERKEFYIKKLDNEICEYFIKHKYYTIRSGLYPSFSRIKKIKQYNMRDYSIYNFIKNENVELSCCDAIEIIKKNKDNNEAILLIDPPYINTCNNYYINNNMNIYEWIFNNNINEFKSDIHFIVENVWINKLLFKNNLISESYKKTYQCSKKKTEHIIIKKNNNAV